MLPQTLAIEVGQQSHEQKIVEQAQAASEEVGDQVAGEHEVDDGDGRQPLLELPAFHHGTLTPRLRLRPSMPVVIVLHGPW